MRIKAPPGHIAFILNRLSSEGHEGYLVGGSVRDAVLNRTVSDWDIATSAKPVEVASLFPKTVLTGEKFGTVTVVLPECSVEVTTFRTESDYIDGRHPENIEFATDLSEDLSRRDFTINAMAANVEGEIIDPFDAQSDIEKGIIRGVGGPNTRFSEDALRMFRALRFSAELGFEIEPETLKAIYANTGTAAQISSERIRIELEKTLMSQRPEVAGEMIKIGLLGRFVAVSGKNPEGLEKIANLPQEAMLRWCAFCAVLIKKDYIKTATELLHNLHLDGKTIKTCLRALTISEFTADKTEIKLLLSKNDAEIVRCAAAAFDVTEKSSPGAVSLLRKTDDILKSGECVTIGNLAVAGKDLLELGHSSGKGLGETLNKLLEHVIENPKDNTREKLLDIVETIKI